MQLIFLWRKSFFFYLYEVKIAFKNPTSLLSLHTLSPVIFFFFFSFSSSSCFTISISPLESFYSSYPSLFALFLIISFIWKNKNHKNFYFVFKITFKLKNCVKHNVRNMSVRLHIYYIIVISITWVLDYKYARLKPTCNVVPFFSEKPCRAPRSTWWYMPHNG